MFTLEGIRKLHHWTHASLSLLLNHLSKLPSEALNRELKSFGINTVQRQLIHIFNCEGFWISILQRENYTDADCATFPDIAEAIVLQKRITGITLRYLSTIADEQLNANADLHFPDGNRAVRTPALILHHVFTHAFHHKGQVVAMCRELGYPAPDTDLNQFE